MHRLVHFVRALCLTLSLPVLAVAGDPPPHVDLVVGPRGPSLNLDRNTLREIFLKRIVVDDAGQPLVPLNLPADDPMRAAVAQTLLGKTPEGLQAYWNQRYFDGVSPPYVVGSEEAVLRFLAETPGALGYVASCWPHSGTRVVAELEVPPGLRGRVEALCRDARLSEARTR